MTHADPPLNPRPDEEGIKTPRGPGIVGAADPEPTP